MELARSDNEENDHDSSNKNLRSVLLGIFCGLALAAMSQTLVSTALPTIVGEFRAYRGVSWVASIYLLTSALIVPFSGSLSDRFGGGRLYKVSIAVFAVGSLMAAVSPSITFLIVARGIQGIGGGSIMTVAFIFIGQIAPARELGRYQGYVAAVFATTSLLGPLVGGFFVDFLSWRISFFLVFFLSLFALWITRSAFPVEVVRERTKFDSLGSILMVFFVAQLLLLIKLVPWSPILDSPIVWILGCLLVIELVFLIRYEMKIDNPLLPFSLFSDRVIVVAAAIAFFSGITMFGVVIYAPTFLQVSLNMSATISGLLLVPLMGCTLVGSTVGGRIMSRTGHFKKIAVIGSFCLVIGTGLMTSLSANSPPLLVSVFVGVVGIGTGLVMPVTLVAVQSRVEFEKLGVATALTQFLRKIGSTIGVAAFGVFFNFQVNQTLQSSSLVSSGVDPQSLLQKPSEISELSPKIASLVRDAVADGAVISFRCAFGISVLGLLVSFLLKDTKLLSNVKPGIGEN